MNRIESRDLTIELVARLLGWSYFETLERWLTLPAESVKAIADRLLSLLVNDRSIAIESIELFCHCGLKPEVGEALLRDDQLRLALQSLTPVPRFDRQVTRAVARAEVTQFFCSALFEFGVRVTDVSDQSLTLNGVRLSVDRVVREAASGLLGLN